MLLIFLVSSLPEGSEGSLIGMSLFETFQTRPLASLIKRRGVIDFKVSFLKNDTLKTSKYNSNEFNKFVFILNQLKEKSKFDKTEFIELVTLVYALNPNGKGKVRKRTLSELISIIQKT